MNCITIRVIWALPFLLALASGSVGAEPWDPDNPSAPVPEVRYRPVLHDYRPQEIVEKPGNWRELNDRAEQIGGPGGQLRSPDEPIRKKRQ